MWTLQWPCLALALPGRSMEAPKKQQHRQSPMDKRAFEEVQISSGEVPAQCWMKKKMNWMHRGGYAEQCDSTCITLYPTQHSLGPGEIFSACEYSCGGNERNEWAPGFPSYAGPFSLTPTRVLTCELHYWRVRRGWKRGTGLWRTLKGCRSYCVVEDSTKKPVHKWPGMPCI